MERKAWWFIYLTFSSPDVVQGHWTMACSNCYSVTPLIIADHVEPESNITQQKPKQKKPVEMACTWNWMGIHFRDESQFWYAFPNKHNVCKLQKYFISVIFKNQQKENWYKILLGMLIVILSRKQFIIHKHS